MAGELKERDRQAIQKDRALVYKRKVLVTCTCEGMKDEE
jgi:hypothetical protein